jgi:uncharacterized membrane protein HdeD (DUF308 family)
MPMRSLLQKAAPTMILSGMLSVVFGVLALALPHLTLITLAWLFAVCVIAQGISQILIAIMHRGEEGHWWKVFLFGLINLAAGVVAIFYPGASAIFLILLMGVSWLVIGIMQIIGGISLRREIHNEGWLIFTGVTSVVAGLYVLSRPGSGALSLVWLVAIYAFCFGCLLIFFGYKARNWPRRSTNDFM